MKFNREEMKIIENFFKWIDNIFENERYEVKDSYIHDKQTGKTTTLDVGYGIEMIESIKNHYYNEYYRENLNENHKPKKI